MTARDEVIRCARGLVRTAHPTIRDEGVVVPEWWDALLAAIEALANPEDPTASTDERSVRTKVVLTVASARPIPLARAQAWIHNASFHGISLHEDGIAQPGDPRPDQDGWEYVKILNVELGDDGLSNPVGQCPTCDSDDLQWQAGDDDRVVCTDCDWHGWPEELRQMTDADEEPRQPPDVGPEEIAAQHDRDAGRPGL